MCAVGGSGEHSLGGGRPSAPGSPTAAQPRAARVGRGRGCAAGGAGAGADHQGLERVAVEDGAGAPELVRLSSRGGSGGRDQWRWRAVFARGVPLRRVVLRTDMKSGEHSLSFGFLAAGSSLGVSTMDLLSLREIVVEALSATDRV